MINEPYGLGSPIPNAEMEKSNMRWNNIQRINVAKQLLEVAALCLESRCETEGFSAIQLAQSVIKRIE